MAAADNKHGVRRLPRLALAVLLCLVAVAAWAQQPNLLPVDEAFVPHAERMDSHHVAIRWQIADGYYLYRHAFGFALADADKTQLGQPIIPAGRKHEDAYFGPVETYRRSVTVRLPVTGDHENARRIEVQYQGCADAGLCYPPQTETLTIAASDETVQADPGPTVVGGPADPENTPAAGRARPDITPTAPPDNTVDTLAGRLAHAPALTTLALFALLGLGLSLTPCILPMIPIVAGLIGSRDVSRGRAVTLTLAYVLAMAGAYAVFGVVAGYFGANLQAALQRPWVLWPFAGLFILLGTASFGWFDFQIPGRWQGALSRLGQGQRGLAGAAVLGFAAALIAGPCLAPPLAGALLYISTSGDLLLGGAALFCLGLGMGLPLVALAAFGATVLPRAGRWMQEVRVFFGVMLIAVGFWLALRLAAPTTALAAWGGLTLLYGCYLSTRAGDSTAGILARRLVCALLFGYAALAGLGLAIGNGRPAQPLAGLASANGATPATARARFERVTDAAGLADALAAAKARGQPALVDVYADWCVECVQMKNGLFQTPRVRAALNDVAAIELDITAYTNEQRALLEQLNVFGPPTLLFYGPDGSRRNNLTSVGTLDQDALIARLIAIQ
mgnify:CR=1 FL=1